MHAPAPSRRNSEEGTDEDIGFEGSCTQYLDLSPRHSQSHGNRENDLWGILRSVTTHIEHRLTHRIKDNVKDCYYIGRSKSCDILITDKRVSSIHCSVYCDYSQPTLRVFIEDNSSNGTFINDSSTKLSKKQRTELKSGDEIFVINPDLNVTTTDGGPFIFINMRDRLGVQKSIQQAPESITKRKVVGRHIEDEYIIGEQLGSGMCGQVHRCLHRSSNVQYAVKIINTRRFSLTPGLSPRELKEEANIMRNLYHVSCAFRYVVCQ
jgi:pSer/pThr/pTyr-binding forkhead associated (FHA) protein